MSIINLVEPTIELPMDHSTDNFARMWRNYPMVVGLTLAMGLPHSALAGCGFLNSDQSPSPAKHDALFEILNTANPCPKNVQELKKLLQDRGLTSSAAQVANRGFHNSSLGSFSFFESVFGQPSPSSAPLRQGDFFFGHFTEATSEKDLVLMQAPEGLMIELIVWDSKKGAYNFYELIGDGKNSTWFYRGDSFDIFEDNRELHLQSDPLKPRFGTRLRCSGCHASGGPILKELEAPNNDWWQSRRPLPLFGLIPDPEVREILASLQETRTLAASVKAGIDRLEKSPQVQKVKQGLVPLPSGRKYSLRETLRPLFTTVEINFESDLNPLDSALPEISIPSGFFMDPRLALSQFSITKASYRNLLEKSDSRFPETTRRDGDHAWLTPVKSYSDIVAISELVSSGFIQEKFVIAVLAVDSERPIFSEQRASLLKHLPEFASGGWINDFVEKLRSLAILSNHSVEGEAARQFLRNYLESSTENLRTESFQKLQQAASRLQTATGPEVAFRDLIERRRSLANSEISKNPRGQILEPGFRVLFPESPWKASCETELE